MKKSGGWAGNLLRAAGFFAVCCAVSGPAAGCVAQDREQPVSGWQMQYGSRIGVSAALASSERYRTEGWLKAVVPGTALTTLVANGVYPEPLYGENMRAIPESLNKTDYWYRALVMVPAANKGRLTWLHFGGINYQAEVWVNGQRVGTMKGAFRRGDFDITGLVHPGRPAVVLVVVSPEPHPGVPHEHTIALGEGKNGGETAIDGPTFLSTIGWDWLPAIRDRDTGIYQPVSLSSTGPVVVGDYAVRSKVDLAKQAADLSVAGTLENETSRPVSGVVIGTITGGDQPIVVRREVTLAPGKSDFAFDAGSMVQLHVEHARLWWPNGYGPQNMYKMRVEFVAGKAASSAREETFGIRRIDYQVADSENLTLSVNGVRVMVRGGNWGLDEALKRVPYERLDAQFRMHAQANMNMIRNWVGQSTSPEFYELADKYGILLWDEFFQPNPLDGPDPADVATYLANVADKVTHYRNHPSIALWCARNEGYPPKDLDDALKSLVGGLDPSRLYQSNSTDGRGVSSHGPYYWRSPRYFYRFDESFKTETGTVSIPTIESIQGMMPQKDWETINDDWAQHDLTGGAQRGTEYPQVLARRYGHIQNLADFVRKGQLANYEAYRAMYESRNAEMFQRTTGVITWMSHPAQPSFVWQLYHYDLEPNSSLFAVREAGEKVHVQLNEVTGAVQVINNGPDALKNLTVRARVYNLDGTLSGENTFKLAEAAGSRATRVGQLDVSTRVSATYFVKLDLVDAAGQALSTNFYWQNAFEDDFRALETMPRTKLEVTASASETAGTTSIVVTLHNGTDHVALMTHLQLRDKALNKRVLPVFYSDNYVSLVPGESRTVTIEASTRNVGTGGAVVLVDGFNVDVDGSQGVVAVGPNVNAQPSHWPRTNLVVDRAN